jgi:hypothetical protein
MTVFNIALPEADRKEFGRWIAAQAPSAELSLTRPDRSPIVTFTAPAGTVSITLNTHTIVAGGPIQVTVGNAVIASALAPYTGTITLQPRQGQGHQYTIYGIGSGLADCLQGTVTIPNDAEAMHFKMRWSDLIKGDSE